MIDVLANAPFLTQLLPVVGRLMLLVVAATAFGRGTIAVLLFLAAQYILCG